MIEQVIPRRTALELMGLGIATLLAGGCAPHPPQLIAPKYPSTEFKVGANLWKDPYAEIEDVQRSLSELKSIKASYVRTLAFDARFPAQYCARRLDTFLRLAREYDLDVIVALIDKFEDKKGYPQGLEPFYSVRENGFQLLAPVIYKEANRYLFPYIEPALKVMAQHDNIFAVEPVNEPKVFGHPQALVPFFQDFSRFIRGRGLKMPIAAGISNTSEIGLTNDQFYGVLKELIGTVHIYDQQADLTEASWTAAMMDLAWAKAQNRLIIAEEYGSDAPGDRSDWFDQAAERLDQAGASALFLAGLIGQDANDTGSGDKIYGVDHHWHPDYQAVMRALFFHARRSRLRILS